MKTNMQDLIIAFSLFLLMKSYRADDLHEDAEEMAEFNKVDSDISPLNDVLKYIEMFEEVSTDAKTSVREDVLPRENTEDHYNEMTAILQDIIDLNMNTANVHKFLHAKGLDRVVAPNLQINYTPLRRQLLILTKQLFDLAPKFVKNVIPMTIVDNILQIFEDDNDSSIKAYALDILYLWLPGNPKVQVRVMKLKGLDPFYNQIANLDIMVVRTLLDLFNKILGEHIEARREDGEKTKEQAENLVYYQRIGLLERMSTAHVCNGLLNIFEISLPFLSKTGHEIPSMFDLIKKIKPFCLKVFKGKPKPIQVFNELLLYVKDPKTEVEFQKMGINVTDVQAVVEQYAYELKHAIPKDEL